MITGKRTRNAAYADFEHERWREYKTKQDLVAKYPEVAKLSDSDEM